MISRLKEILKNRIKVAGVAFLLEITVGVLSEWQRSSAIGELDSRLRKHGIEPEEFKNDLKL